MSSSPTLERSPRPESPARGLPVESRRGSAGTSLRETIRAIERALEQAYATPGRAEATVWLRDNRSFLRAQVKEVKESFGKKFCARLRGGWPVYHLVSAAIGERFVDWDTRAVAHLLEPECLRASLTLAEVWAIPPVFKLILLERLAAAAAARNSARVIGVIRSLHALDRVRWRDVIESVSPLERILRRDPSGVYANMTFETRDLYRKSVEKIATETGASEEEVASAAMNCAREAWAASRDPRTGHVGHYLIGSGIVHLERRAGLSRSLGTRIARAVRPKAEVFYLICIALAAVALSVAFARALHGMHAWWLALFSIALVQTAATLVNLGVNMTIKPAQLPRLDFSKGIPDDCRTFIVVPALLLSRPVVARLLKQLEIHYLANRDRNLRFALLTDLPDSKSPEGVREPLVDLCARGIYRLNQRHGTGGSGPFYLFHRRLRWNEAEGVWMGRERKRGKLEDFNRFLLGEGDAFESKAGDLEAIGEIRYVITLDSDSQLPRDTAWKLVGTMAHPLNRPVIDPETKMVRRGYAILQPRSTINMESAGQSRLARIYSGDTGLDPYATAISNVYQDLCGAASYTGKGIYDLRAFHTALDGRFPDQTLLSHDLIEGEHARTGLVTDIDILEDYPSSYESHSKRKHRWVRGDWQIFPYAFGRNPLPLISRWKIFDNLRRSLFEVALLAAIVSGAAIAPNAASRVLAASAALLLLPAYVEFAASVWRVSKIQFLPGHVRELLSNLERAHAETFLMLAFLPHQALLMTDAIVRTLVRMFITRRRLLEWESMAQAELNGRTIHFVTLYLIACPLLTLAFAVSWSGPLPAPLFTLLALWMGSPLLAQFVSAPPERAEPEQPSDVDFLREISLRTWRFFEDFSAPESNWLVPDNVQMDPGKVAHQASPTNIGLQLSSAAAARHLGYVTHAEFAERIRRVLETIQRMPRHRGHLYNWYDTRTLDILAPNYVSTVDSGNLAAALITLKQELAAMPRQAVIGPQVLAGLRDHVTLIASLLPQSMRGGEIMPCLASLLRLLDSKPTNLLFWRGLLGDITVVVQELNLHLDWACRYLAPQSAQTAEELRYWQRSLQQRVDSALAELCSLAPWMAHPFHEELRARAANPAFQELMEIASGIPVLGDLADTYDALECAVESLLARPAGAGFRAALERLLGQIASARTRAGRLMDQFAACSRTASRLALGMDFRFLLDGERNLLRIGYDVASGRLDDSYYDLLASEARTAVFFAVAKGDAPREVWFSLGRKITSFRGFRTLMSWSGSMFEYLMPSLFMKTFAPTLLYEMLTGVVRIQQTYAREYGIPWGVSESACSAREADLRYRYRAFGIPAVSLRQRSEDEPADRVVVAPYASVLALLVDRATAVENLREIAGRGWMGRYGFFESIDFPVGPGEERRPDVVRSFMAHHQGMTLLALCNTLCDNVIQRRFHADPLVAAAQRLLQERARASLLPLEENAAETGGTWRDRFPSFKMEF